MIEVRNVSFSYWPGTGREHSVLRNVSVTLAKGEWGVLIGGSGSGKSTLLYLLCGFLFPFGGKIFLEGEELTRKSAAKVRKKIGLILQFPENQLFAPTVYEEVAYGLKRRGLPSEKIFSRVMESLEKVGLDPDTSVSPFQLSLGEMRKLSFAATLALNPSILLLDEPTAGLDPKGKRAFLDLVSGLRQNGITILQVTHRMDELLCYADRFFFLSEGSILSTMGVPDLLAAAWGDDARIERLLPPSLLRLKRVQERFPGLSFPDFSLEAVAVSLRAAGGGP